MRFFIFRVAGRDMGNQIFFLTASVAFSNDPVPFAPREKKAVSPLFVFGMEEPAFPLHLWIPGGLLSEKNVRQRSAGLARLDARGNLMPAGQNLKKEPSSYEKEPDGRAILRT